uniref:Uncharacterized protein n=1 Tax=Bursaphelenchus xylophilus TaxID=6326 RepID=A0A1I7S1Q5_BURXY
MHMPRRYQEEPMSACSLHRMQAQLGQYPPDAMAPTSAKEEKRPSTESNNAKSSFKIQSTTSVPVRSFLAKTTSN